MESMGRSSRRDFHPDPHDPRGLAVITRNQLLARGRCAGKGKSRQPPRCNPAGPVGRGAEVASCAMWSCSSLARRIRTGASTDFARGKTRFHRRCLPSQQNWGLLFGFTPRDRTAKGLKEPWPQLALPRAGAFPFCVTFRGLSSMEGEPKGRAMTEIRQLNLNQVERGVQEALRNLAGDLANGGGEMREITAAERIDKSGT